MRGDRFRELADLIKLIRGRRVVVLGDMILDEFIYGTAVRVSREAPVVIVRYDGDSFLPGGASNAAQNVAAMGGGSYAVGVVGDDDEGRRLMEILEERGVDTNGIVVSSGRYTTKKVRVMAGEYNAQKQQVVRIDKENGAPLDSSIEKELLRNYSRALKGAEAVLLSDYNQGVFSRRVAIDAIAMAKERGVPVVVDSRFQLACFKGATIATPNELEAAQAVGEDAINTEIEMIGRKLLRLIRSEALLVTRGSEGMALFERRKRTKYVGVIGSSEATDVTGAGDTVSSAVALSLAAGMGFESAMHLSNVAASIVVMKRGVATASFDEISEKLKSINDAGDGMDS